jgi:hypothetical protein
VTLSFHLQLPPLNYANWSVAVAQEGKKFFFFARFPPDQVFISGSPQIAVTKEPK